MKSLAELSGFTVSDITQENYFVAKTNSIIVRPKKQKQTNKQNKTKQTNKKQTKTKTKFSKL